jgi:protein TonB
MTSGLTRFGDRFWVRRWLLSATIIVTLHGVGFAAVLAMPSVRPAAHEPAAILLDLAPLPAVHETPREKPQSEPEPVSTLPDPEPESLDETPVQPEATIAVLPPRPKPKLKPPEPPKPIEAIRRDKLPEPPAPEPAPLPPAASAHTTTADNTVARPLEMASAAHAAAVRASFQRRLLAHLERHKRYPRMAETRHQTGTGYLRFTMDRSGNVLSFHVVKSSGHTLLDDEILDLIRRAQPLPVPPPEQDQLEFTAPIQFYIANRHR